MFGIVSLALGCEPLNVDGVLKTVDAAIDDGAPERGLEVLDGAWQALPDACTPLSQADLSRLAWRGNGHATVMGRASDAQTWTDRACTVAPTLPGPQRQACPAGVATSSFIADLDLLVDGVPYPRGGPVTLPVGVHVVHWELGGSWSGRRFTLEEGTKLRLPSADIWRPDVVTEKKKSPTIVLPLAMVAGGGALAAGGGVVFQTLFADRWNTECRLAFDYNDGWDRCEAEAGVPLSGGYYAGIGLMAAGAAIGVTGLGLGLPVLLSTDGRSVVVSGRF